MKTSATLQRTLQALFLTGISIFALAPAFAADTVKVTARKAKKPRLVLQITVDQFRGDLPTRYFDRLGKGGLRYLLEDGIHYNNAHHAHANTETIVGHVTLATGAHPAAHGMIGNIWVSNESEILFNRRVSHENISDFTANPASPFFNWDLHLCFSAGFRCGYR